MSGEKMHQNYSSDEVKLEPHVLLLIDIYSSNNY